MQIHKLLAKKISYAAGRRSRKAVKYIVIHNTGNPNDTAKNNALYFKNSNTRQAGAHFFVDQSGEVYKSVNMNRTAWSVGDFFTQKDGAGKYYQKCTNYNSVSIELCNIVKKKPSKAQTQATKELVKYIRKYCPNAKTIIRHWDVNGKSCPARMSGKDNKEWKAFKKAIG
ncbi:MAG: N-acetylmuramoyl-L-alanine amidase [Eubacterium sp.]|nr:N-acetylmuramoyl-L-alanine amidase [Eubacterium sp.]